jgi:ketosteroid isomerase-like protein
MARHLMIALAAACCAPAFAATPLETLAHFHQALKNGDAERATALLKPEVQIYESGHVERSRDEYVGHHLPSDIAFAKETDSKVLKQREQVDGNLAVVMQETETTGKFKGKPVHLYGTETVVMEKHGDGWVFSHIHWSSRKDAK